MVNIIKAIINFKKIFVNNDIIKKCVNSIILYILNYLTIY